MQAQVQPMARTPTTQIKLEVNQNLRMDNAIIGQERVVSASRLSSLRIILPQKMCQDFFRANLQSPTSPRMEAGYCGLASAKAHHSMFMKIVCRHGDYKIQCKREITGNALLVGSAIDSKE